jgi:two-component system LytT family response regulator
VAECGHGAGAIEAMRRERPDALFLDVQMPEVDGFEVLRQLEADTVAAVIFVTAYDRYALRAFEQHALGLPAEAVLGRALRRRHRADARPAS